MMREWDEIGCNWMYRDLPGIKPVTLMDGYNMIDYGIVMMGYNVVLQWPTKNEANIWDEYPQDLGGPHWELYDKTWDFEYCEVQF